MMTRQLGIVLTAAVAIVSAPGTCRAQPREMGYVFGGPMLGVGGDLAPGLNMGGGGEAAAGRSATLGAELGYLVVASSPTGFPLLSGNAAYHFRQPNADAGWRPFVTGGITLSEQGFFNGGVGSDRWLSPHRGIRLEGRAYFVPTHDGMTLSMVGFRIGVIFR